MLKTSSKLVDGCIYDITVRAVHRGIIRRLGWAKSHKDIPQLRHALLLVVAEGVKHGVGDLIREESVQHQVFDVAARLGHYSFVAFDTVGDFVGEMQLVVVADLSAVEVVEAVDDLSQAQLLEVVELA